MEITITASKKDLYYTSMALLGCALACKIIGWTSWKVRNMAMTRLSKETLQKRNERTYTFKTEGLDIPFILSLDVKGLREELIKGTFTSVDLVNVFAERNYYIGRALCSTSEEFFDEALEDAQVKDAEREEARKNGTLDQLPLMHGVPISIKDQIKQKGTLSTTGCAFLCTDYAESDGAITALFRKAGAILLVRGNCPQSGLSLHTHNLVFGETKNPYNHGRSPGGSSGGNAAQIAARLVPFGIGSDIGGSLRFPAGFCGIYGYKPTTGRVTFNGLTACNTNRFSSARHLRATAGPMGSTVDDLIIGMKIHSDPNIHYMDPMHPPVPFREGALADVQNPDNFKNIKIGVLTECLGLPMTKAMRRALDESAAAARKLGFDVVPFEITEAEFNQSNDAFMTMASNNSSSHMMLKSMRAGGETFLGPINSLVLTRDAGFFKRGLINFILYYVLNNKRQHRIMKNLRVMDFDTLEVELKKRYDFVEQFSKKWRDSGITALLMPQFPTPAIKLDSVAPMGLMLHYSVLQNVTGFPAGVFPVTKVRADEQDFSDVYGDAWTKCTQNDVEGSEGLPVCIQMVGYSYEDEQVLGLMKVLSKEIGYKLDLFEDELAKYKK